MKQRISCSYVQAFSREIVTLCTGVILELSDREKFLDNFRISGSFGLGIICRPNHADQWTMDRSAVDLKGAFCRPSILQTRLCADYLVNNFDKTSLLFI